MTIRENSFSSFGQQAIPAKLAPSLTSTKDGRVPAVDIVHADKVVLKDNTITKPGPHGDATPTIGEPNK